MGNISWKESLRLGRLAKAHDGYQKLVKRLPNVGNGWTMQSTIKSLREAKRKAKNILGSHHSAVIPSYTGKGYEIWASEVSTVDIKKAPKDARYICRLIDFTLKKIKPHNFYKRGR